MPGYASSVRGTQAALRGLIGVIHYKAADVHFWLFRKPKTSSPLNWGPYLSTSDKNTKTTWWHEQPEEERSCRAGKAANPAGDGIRAGRKRARAKACRVGKRTETDLK